jgi:hydroxyacylglutathione hydrolase
LVRILPDLYLVGGSDYGLSNDLDCNVYLIDGGGPLALIDSGGGRGIEQILANIKREGIDPSMIKYLVLTHCHFDHSSGSQELKNMTGCEVCIHESEASAMEKADPDLTGKNSILPLYSSALSGLGSYNTTPCQVDRSLTDGDVIDVGKYSLSIIHTPGHSMGSITMQTIIGGRNALFTGDSLFTDLQTPFMNMPGSSLPLYADSIKKLADTNRVVPIDALLPGHRGFTVSNGQNHLLSMERKIKLPYVAILSSFSNVSISERFLP